MAGVPGKGGPVPKRSDQRRRRNKSPIPVESAPGAADVQVPPARDEWHPLARDWYEALAASGQKAFYQPSDWATARYIAEAMSRNLNSGDRFSGVLFASVMSGMANLLVTEGDRRRLRIELESAKVDPDEDAAVIAINDYQSRFSS